ncbi:MAG: hypothetical protein RJA44_106, partial [Pseudomonadota bacterium]
TRTVNVTVLPAPTLALAAESDLGVSNTDRVTTAPVIVLEGGASAGQTLLIRGPQGQLLGTVVADANGHWNLGQIDLSALQGDNSAAAAGAAGNYSFSVTPLLPSGAEGTPGRITVVREIEPVTTPAPAAALPDIPTPAPAPAPSPSEAPAERNTQAFDSALVTSAQSPNQIGSAGTAEIPTFAPAALDTRPAQAGEPRGATEGDIYTRPSGFRIMVSPSSEPSLKLFHGMADRVLPLGQSVDLQVPADAFVHTVLTETVMLKATLADGTDLPDWLSFDGKAGRFIGDPPTGADIDLAIRLNARDSQGREAYTIFRMTLKERTTSSRPGLSQQLARGEALVFKPGQRLWQAQARPQARS